MPSLLEFTTSNAGRILFPGFFSDVHVLRDPVYNVGHWNLPDRVITVVDNVLLVNGERCRRASLQRLRLRAPGGRHQVFATLDTRERRTCRNRLRVLSVPHWTATAIARRKEWPYAYGVFDNGAPVPDVARALLAEMGDDGVRFGDPLRMGPGSYYDWLNRAADGGPNRPGR